MLKTSELIDLWRDTALKVSYYNAAEGSMWFKERHNRSQAYIKLKEIELKLRERDIEPDNFNREGLLL